MPHGAYHAGVLKALEEAGVKIDVMAGQGVGGGRGRARRRRRGIASVGSKGNLAQRSSQILLPVENVRARGRMACVPVHGPDACDVGSARDRPRVRVGALADRCGPYSCWRAADNRRRGRHRGSSRFKAAIRRKENRGGGCWERRWTGTARRSTFAGALWELLHAGGPVRNPTRADVGRRYAEVFDESVGQPGFRELMIVATDLDSRRDIVAALLRDPFRRDFVARDPGKSGGRKSSIWRGRVASMHSTSSRRR